MAILDVIQYNGENNVFAWKYPKTQFYSGSQLIVNESQEAVLVKNGEIYDIFGAGRYTLDTSTVPLLNQAFNLSFGNKSPFVTEIWYINKVFNLDVKWGTPSPIQIQDPKYNVFVPVRSNGVFGIQIKDSVKFLTKLVGTADIFDVTAISQYFRGLYVTKIKDAISSYLLKNEISILEINAYLDEISEFMCKKIQPVMEEYGIQLVSFYVNEISVPEDDSAVKQLKDALSKKAEMDIIGYNYQQERSFDTLEHAAKHSNVDIKNIQSITKEIQTNQKICPNCAQVLSDTQRYCENCGYDTQQTKIICTSCGSHLSKSSKFCPECGQPLTEICPSCHTTIDRNAKFCPNCGKKLK